VEHSILTSVWHMLTNDTGYHDLGADHYLRRDPERERRRPITAMNKLGYTVTLNPIEPTTQAAGLGQTSSHGCLFRTRAPVSW
jgi:transposase